MKRLTLLFVAVSLFVASPVMAGEKLYLKKGNELLNECNEAQREITTSNTFNTANTALCYGFISGVADTHSSLIGILISKPIFCAYRGVSAQQLLRIVVKFLNEHPEMLHGPASDLVLKALIEAFPCPESQTEK